LESLALFVATSFLNIALRERRVSEDKAKDTLLLTSLLLLQGDTMLFQHMEPSNGSPAPMLGRVSWRTLAAMAVAFLPFLAPTRARADLGVLSNDAVFATNIQFEGSHGGGVTVTGNVAVGSGGSITGGQNGGSVINGNLDLGTGVTGHTGVTVNGGTTTNDSSLTGLTGTGNLISTASAAYGNMSATGSTTIFDNGTVQNNGTGQLNGAVITGIVGTNVVDVRSINGSITLGATGGATGGANDIFIINTTTLSLSGGVTLRDGVTANHVLFNVTGTNGTVQLSGTLNGTFLVPSVAVSFGGGGTLNGAIIDGSLVMMDIDSQSNTTINGEVFSGLAVAAPEPAPLVKAISGLVTVGLWGFLRRKKRSK
jgi:hypothetical protein